MLLPSVREHYPAKSQPIFDDLERIISNLRDAARPVSFLELDERGVPPLNAYIAFAVAVYVVKFQQLYECIVESLNSDRHLTYALAARSVIENAATIRHYARHNDFRALRDARSAGRVTTALLNAAILRVDRLIRGNRFTWEAFISKRI